MSRSYRCPNCNSTLSVSDNEREIGYCQYCGTRLIKSTNEREIDLAFEITRNESHAIENERLKIELEHIQQQEERDEARRLRREEREERYGKIIGKVFLFPGWLLTLYLIWYYIGSGGFSSALLGILLFLLDLVVGGIVVIILLLKKW